MGDNNTTDFHDAAQEAEDALSLCDLHLDVEDNTTNNFNLEEITRSENQIQSHSAQQSSYSSSSSSSSHGDQFFEFLSVLSSDMCPAEDIIFCGKLIPSTPQPSASSPLQQTKSLSNEDNKQGALHRRPESLYNFQSYVTLSNSTKNYQFLRISRSFDYQRLRRLGSSKTPLPDLDIKRSASASSWGKADNRKAASKPKWYLPLFGIVKFPPQMDMRDIKSRQIRRISSETERDFPASRSTGKDWSSSSSSSSWRFMKALSCSDHASVAVTAPFQVSHT